MPTSHFGCPVSTATRVTLCQLPSIRLFVQLLTRSLIHFRSRRDRGLRPLFGFAPKQTKGSSAWRTIYIVLHYVYMRNNKDCIYVLVGRVFATGPGARGSIWCRVIPKTQKMYLIFPWLTLSIIRYISKVEWSTQRKKCSTLPYTAV